MALSNELVSQFAKIANSGKKQAPTETTVYGTAVMYEGKPHVKLDGSDLLTPVQTTSSIKDGDRVTVTIKNHTATIMGNTSDPSVSSSTMAYNVTTDDLEAITATIQQLTALSASMDYADILKADIQKLYAKFAELDTVTAKDVTAINAEIESLRAEFATVGNLSAEELNAINGVIDNLKGYTADFTYVSADVLSAFRANIKELDAQKLSATDADIKYANIDFTNIGEAAIENFLSKSGIIDDLVVSEGHVTGKLVGVTIIGDLIEGGTVKADKLVVLGDDGLYYKLNVNGEKVSAKQTEYNSLHGSIITAKSVTAEKVNVDDLVAFDAKIAGLNLTNGSIYSGAKSSVDNTTNGFYLDNAGQMALGDSTNFLRYYEDENGIYRLEISAGSIVLKAGTKNIEEAIDEIAIGGRNLIRHSVNMIFDDYYFEEVPTIDGEFIADDNDYVLLDNNDDMLFV